MATRDPDKLMDKADKLRTAMEHQSEGSAESRRPSLPDAIDGAGDPISPEHLSRMVATIVEKVLRQVQTRRVEEEEKAALGERPPIVEPAIQSRTASPSTTYTVPA